MPRHVHDNHEGSRRGDPAAATVAAVQSTLCTRRDNNLLTRTCRLKKMVAGGGEEGPPGETGLSYECEFLSRADYGGGKERKKRDESWGTTPELTS